MADPDIWRESAEDLHDGRGNSFVEELGPKEVEADAVFVGRRDKEPRDRVTLPRAEFVQSASEMLSQIQENLLKKAKELQEEGTTPVDSLDEFKEFFTETHDDARVDGGGFVLAHWNDSAEGNEVLAELKVTPRCVSLDGDQEPGECIFTGKPSKQRVIFAKAY